MTYCLVHCSAKTVNKAVGRKLFHSAMVVILSALLLGNLACSAGIWCLFWLFNLQFALIWFMGLLFQLQSLMELIIIGKIDFGKALLLYL